MYRYCTSIEEAIAELFSGGWFCSFQDFESIVPDLNKATLKNLSIVEHGISISVVEDGREFSKVVFIKDPIVLSNFKLKLEKNKELPISQIK